MSESETSWRWLGWVHPSMPFIVWLPVALAAIIWGTIAGQLSLREVALLGVGALLTWSLLEYTLHRWLFHPPKSWGAFGRLVHRIHAKHHNQPLDRVYALVPPVNAAVVLLILTGIFSLIIPIDGLSLFTGFFILGYLFYELLHLAMHHRKPTTLMGRFLYRHHLRHHGNGEEGNYGVTSPLWDWLLATSMDTGKTVSSNE
jgi:sterol desaturase/sphingolipid hydroxylase (fatty acid hydroxylase superfamily)